MTILPMRAIVRSLATLGALLLVAAVAATAQSLELIEPNGGETFTAGVSSVTISWFEAGIDIDDQIEVEFTVDGTNWRRIDRVNPDVRSVTWVPDRSGSQARVRITSKNDESITDMSDGTFVIESDPNDVTRVVAPNGGEVWRSGETRTISWQAPADAVGILLELSTNGGTGWSQIATVAATTTSYQWTLPDVAQETTTALVRVSVAEAVDHADVSDAAFTIRPRLRPTLTVVAPNGGERFRRDSLTTVRWTTTNVEEDGPEVAVEYSADSGRTWQQIATEDATEGSHSWLVPNRPTRFALVRVVAVDRTFGDTSNAFFTIVGDTIVQPPPPDGDTTTIAFTEVGTGTVWTEGDLQRIVWTSNVTDDLVMVVAVVSGRDGAAAIVEVGSAPVGNGAVSWRVPRLQDSVSDVRIIAWLRRSGAADTSAAIEVRHRPVVAGIGDAHEVAAPMLYPNPAVDRVAIRLGRSSGGSVRLYGADGRLVRRAELVEGGATVSLAGLASGRYIVEVVSEGAVTRSPLVVVR